MYRLSFADAAVSAQCRIYAACDINRCGCKKRHRDGVDRGRSVRATDTTHICKIRVYVCYANRGVPPMRLQTKPPTEAEPSQFCLPVRQGYYHCVDRKTAADATRSLHQMGTQGPNLSVDRLAVCVKRCLSRPGRRLSRKKDPGNAAVVEIAQPLLVACKASFRWRGRC